MLGHVLGSCLAELLLLLHLHLLPHLLAFVEALLLHLLPHLLTFVEALLFRCGELPLVLLRLCLTALSHLQSSAGFIS
jgi:hypothetical protein